MFVESWQRSSILRTGIAKPIEPCHTCVDLPGVSYRGPWERLEVGRNCLIEKEN